MKERETAAGRLSRRKQGMKTGKQADEAPPNQLIKGASGRRTHPPFVTTQQISAIKMRELIALFMD